MFVEAQATIIAPRETIWKAISDIQRATHVFKDIKSIEVLDQPAEGLVGLKWKEVREFMGKEAIETMWISEASPNHSYTAEAYNAGCVYHSGYRLENREDGTISTTKSFRCTPQSLFARLMAPAMWLMKGTLRNCLERDLKDLKTFVEN